MRSAPAVAVSILIALALPSLVVPQTQAAGPTQAVPPTANPGLEGKVLSDAGGPLGGATVRVQNAANSGATTSEANGTYSMQLPPGAYNVTVTATGHATFNGSVVIGALMVQQDFTIHHTGSVVSGSVRDATTGAAVSGARVEANPDDACRNMPCTMAPMRPVNYQPPTSTVSDSRGHYAIGVEKGNVSLVASKDGYQEDRRGIDANRDVFLDFRLSSIPARSAVLSGQVVDAKTGQPVAGAYVSAYGTYGGGPASPCPPEADCVAATYPCCYDPGNSTQADAQGRFRMGMMPGRYTLNVYAQDYGSHQEPVELAANQTLALTVRLDPIPPDSVTVRGQVVDKATGKPVEGVTLSVENQQWGQYNGTQTSSDGRFSLRTKPGWTLIWVRSYGVGYVTQVAVAVGAPGSAGGNNATSGSPGSTTPAPQATPEPAPTSEPTPATPSAQPMLAKPMPPYGNGEDYYPWVTGKRLQENQVLDLRIELQPRPKADVRIEGYVLNATSQKPVPGAQVSVRNEDTGDWGSATTDKDGSFAILGRAGVHTIGAWADGYFTNSVVLTVQGPATRMDLALEPGRQQGGCCAIAYAEGNASTTSGAPAPNAAPRASSVDTSSRSSSASQSALQGQGPATYQRASGGLGPYRPGQVIPGNPVITGTPGFEAVAVAAAVGLAGLALRRRW